MKRTHALILVGAVSGLFLGSSMGIAVGGTAYNAAFFMVPLGAFIGWLIASKAEANSTAIMKPDAAERRVQYTPVKDESNYETKAPTVRNTGVVSQIIEASLTILAWVWNFHIDILAAVRLLPHFRNHSWLFLLLGFLMTLVFPPLAFGYFLTWMGATHFGISPESNFRAKVQ